MKKQIKKAISVMLAVIMMTSITALAFSAGAAEADNGKKITEYNVGDMIYFGSYPQSKVTDESIIGALNEIEADWLSYGYTSGDSADWTWDNGSARSGDYMKYCDVEYNGEYYRGVTFTQYRPYSDNLPSSTSTDYTYQSTNGYYINTNYWFKFEPLTWRVLDPDEGLVICEFGIDSQPFSDTLYWIDKDNDGERDFDTEYFKDAEGTIYANNYAESSIRSFLNDSFYNTAFDRLEKSQINSVTRDNKACEDQYSAYDSIPTTDKVTLLSSDELHNGDYGLSTVWGVVEEYSRTTATDYACIQGLNKSSYVTVRRQYAIDFWLRSAGTTSRNACYAWHGGSSRLNITVCYTDVAVCPVINLDTNAIIAPSDYPIPVSIEIDTARTSYKYKEALQLSQLVVKLNYSDGTSNKVLYGFTVDGYDPYKIGTQTLTVHLMNLTTEYEVTVSYTWWQNIIRYVFFGWLWY